MKTVTTLTFTFSKATDMKIKIFCAVLIAVMTSHSAFSQWNSNGTHIFNTNAGNVGIGINNPAFRLHVSGNSNAARFDGRVYANGNVGIFQSNPTFPLQFANATGNKICLYQNTNGQYGLGIAGSQMQLYVPTASEAFVFGTGSSTAFTERMRIAGSGNVGIGIANPGHRLHVLTSNNIYAGYFVNNNNTSSETFGLRAESNNPGAGNATGAYFRAVGGGGGLGLSNQGVFSTASGNLNNVGINAEATSANGQVAIGLRASASGNGINLAARFDGNVYANGNVGIFQPSPVYPLQFANATGNKICLYQNPGGLYGLGISDNLMQLYVPTSSDAFVFGAGSSTAFTERMRIGGNGNVGIGTIDINNNQSRLAISNSQNFRAATFSTDVSFNSPNDAFGTYTVSSNNGRGNSTGGYFEAVCADSTAIASGLNVSSSGGGVSFGIRSHAVSDNAHAVAIGLIASTGGPGSNIAAFLDGRVGIGTLNVPDGYLLSVDGRVICEEVRVQLSGEWPDYVLQENYPLMPLEEVEKNIKSNKHLPGIPSAAQIEKEGIAVGDMQTKMMVKIEELTLYMIQMKKENDELRREVAEMKKR